MDVALAIEALVPAAQYGRSTTKNTKYCFDTLRWEDSRKKPTWKELETAWVALEPTLPDPEVEAKITAKKDEIQRAEAVAALIIAGELEGKAEDYIKIGG